MRRTAFINAVTRAPLCGALETAGIEAPSLHGKTLTDLNVPRDHGVLKIWGGNLITDNSCMFLYNRVYTMGSKKLLKPGKRNRRCEAW